MVRFGRVQTMLVLGMAVIALGTVGVPQAAAQAKWLPLQMVGYNADVIADADQDVRFSQLFDAGCCAWFESGATDDAGNYHADGIPAGSTFSSMTGSGVNYLIQPAVYNNVLQISNDPNAQAQGVPPNGTLTLLAPAAYSQIAIFASSGNGGGVGTLTVNYADNTTLAASVNAFDWCGGSHAESVIPPNSAADPNTGNVPTGIGRIGSGITATGSSKFSYQFVCGPQGFEAYETIIATDNTKKIVSVTFTALDPGVNRTSVFGISAIQ
jgi:hypothetical protein